MSDKKEKNVIVLSRLQSLMNSKESRTAIAKDLGCDVSTITKHFNGDRAVTTEYLLKYAKYFNVSADYLLGLSDVSRPDVTITAICEYTGLDEKAVEVLKSLKEFHSSIKTINKLIIDEYYYFEHEVIGADEEAPSFCVLEKIHNYFEMQITDKKINISKSGKLLDYFSTDKEYIKEKFTSINDILSLKEIDVDSVIQRVLLDDIIDSLKKMRKECQAENKQITDHIENENLPF